MAPLCLSIVFSLAFCEGFSALLQSSSVAETCSSQSRLAVCSWSSLNLLPSWTCNKSNWMLFWKRTCGSWVIVAIKTGYLVSDGRELLCHWAAEQAVWCIDTWRSPQTDDGEMLSTNYWGRQTLPWQRFHWDSFTDWYRDYFTHVNTCYRLIGMSQCDNTYCKAMCIHNPITGIDVYVETWHFFSLKCQFYVVTMLCDCSG